MKYKSNKIVTAVLAILLVVVIAGAAALVGVLSNGFKDWTKFQPDEQTEQAEEQADNGGAIINAPVENGVKLMSAKIPVAEYAANGVSAQAETAYTLTATITPADAANKTVDWSVAFVNPSSSWANGKKVTDYVTVTPTSDGALTATVECKQAFGEQIKVTATSTNNPEKSASCTVDYSQKVTGVSVSIGDIDFVENGDTVYPFELAVGVRGAGGDVILNFEKSTVYTIADTFTYSFDDSLFDREKYMQVGAMPSDLTVNYSVLGEALETASEGSSASLYFDCMSSSQSSFGSQFSVTINTLPMTFVSLGSSPLALMRPEILSEVKEVYDDLAFPVQFTLEGTYSSYTYKTTLKMGDVTNNSVVTNVSLNESNIIF